MKSKHHTCASVWLAVLTLLLLPTIGSVAAAAVLVKDGSPSGCIVVPQGTEKGRVLTAAEDLAGYLQKMSGASIPIHRDNEPCAGFRVLIGSTRLAPIEPAEVSEEKVGYDGFVIHTVPSGVVIAGRDPKGTANGVYHFAEEVLGVHWFSVEDDGPTCPQRRTIEVPKLSLTVKPDFAWRSHYWSFQGRDPYKNAATPFAKKLALNRDRWWTFNRLWGIEAEVGHAFRFIVPDELYASHPEYFPYIDYTFKEDRNSPFNAKVIRPDSKGNLPAWPWKPGRYAGGESIQRCFSNPDVLRLTAEWTARQFDAQPELRFASLSANDGPFWCDCRVCKALGRTRSHQALAFANKVAAANKTKYPDRGYLMYAYMHTLDPPSGMKADPAVVPVIAPLWQCEIHPISSNCPDCVYLRRVYQEWSKITNGRIAYHPYTTPGPFTFPGPLALAEKIRFVHDLGAMGFIRENQFTPKVNWAMLNWMETKLLWKANCDPAKLRRQFIEGHYGLAAADSIEKVYIAIEEGAAATVTGRKSSYHLGNGLHEWESGYEALKSVLEKCRPDIEAALAAAEKEPEAFRNRIVRDMEALLGKNRSEF